MDFRGLVNKLYEHDEIYLFVFSNKSAIANHNIYEMADDHKQMGFDVIALMDNLHEDISPYYNHKKLYKQPTANPIVFRILVIKAFKILRRVKKIIYVDNNIQVLKNVQGEPLTTIHYADRRFIKKVTYGDNVADVYTTTSINQNNIPHQSNDVSFNLNDTYF